MSEVATLLALVGRGGSQPKPRYHSPMVRMNEDRHRWLTLFVITFIACSIAAFYFGGAGSGIYDVVTQVHYHIPLTSHTLSLKEAWDASIRDTQRHLWRNGTIVTLAALVVGILRYHPEKYLYAKVNVMDMGEHLLGWPNIKYTLGANRRQRAIAKGELEPDAEFRYEPRPVNKWLSLYRKIITVPLVIVYSVVFIYLAWHGYDWLRDHALHFLPHLGIPSAKEIAAAGTVDKVTNVVTADWVIKVVFFLPLLFTTRFLRDSYHSIQRYLIMCRIGKRLTKVTLATDLSDKPPWYYFPPWRTAYRFYADYVSRGWFAAPDRMSRKAKRNFRILFLLLTVLFLFGHYWIWSHT